MLQQFTRPLAALTILALSACAGSSGGGGTSAPPVVPPQSGAAILTTIAGVGDSLTAGTQSGVTMGEPGTNPLSPYPGNATPPTQENGFFSILFQQAKGLPAAAMYNPATSPLPLIHQPGVGNQTLLTAAGQPFNTHTSGCDAFNQAAFSLGTAMNVVRISATQTVTDVAVPGITAHEALFMTGPITGPASPANGCVYPVIPGDPTSGPLQTIVASESANFLPVLGGFAGKVQPLTMVGAAVSLHPTLSTVWLGANDMLKFTFSGGQAPVDSPSQMQADITQTIQSLQAAGSRVVVANLPDVLSVAQFFQGGVPANPLIKSQTVFYYLQALSKGAISPATAAAIVGPGGPLQTKYGVGSDGYLTETGLFTLLAQLQAGGAAAINLDPNGAGSGLGQLYESDVFAAKAQALNTAYNAAIGAAATATGATLVDIHQAFVNINAAGGMTLSNGQTVSLRFGAGLISFDGLHPSNVGYAVIADAFIQAIDGAFGLTIPVVDPANYYATDPYRIPGI